jgi:Asp/Glu/hydantoin racemase
MRGVNNIKKIAVIHTTPATIESMTSLINKEFGDVRVINILDDSMLFDMIHKNEVSKVEERWLGYAKIAATLDIDAIVSACSSVGEFAEKANEKLPIPVYRIDEAMAEKAVEMGHNISIFATLSSTLEPTVQLVQKKAKFIGKDCNINTVLVPGAYEELLKGNRELHNIKIQEEVAKYAATSDIIVLAQASMASALEGLVGIAQDKILTSPKLGVLKIKNELFNS